MIRLLINIIVSTALFALGLLAATYTVRYTFDGEQLVAAGAVAGALCYLLARHYQRAKHNRYRLTFGTDPRNFSLALIALTLWICASVSLIAIVNTVTGLENRLSFQASVVEKDTSRLKSGGYSYYLHIHSDEYGLRTIWVRQELYDQVEVDEVLRVHLTTNVLGYQVVRYSELVHNKTY